jgi:hypothetical protein
VGRETEGGAIRTVIDRALTGHGSLIMLCDGPGVGKTRLAMEMSEYGSRVGFRCSVGRCYESAEPFPFLPFVEIIESDLAQAASRDDFRRRIGEKCVRTGPDRSKPSANFSGYSATTGTAAAAEAPLSPLELLRGTGPGGSNTAEHVRA